MNNKLGFWKRIVKKYDRLTRNIFEWDWLLRNNNWSFEMGNLFTLVNIDNVFYNQNVCDELV